MITPLVAGIGTLNVLAATDGIVPIELAGEFDMSNSPLIIEQATRVLDDHQALILDFSAATFIDSAVVHALLHLHQRAKTLGKTAVVQLDKSSNVERVLGLTAVDQVINIASKRANALDMARKGTRRARELARPLRSDRRAPPSLADLAAPQTP